jgi:hypothetical protein
MTSITFNFDIKGPFVYLSRGINYPYFNKESNILLLISLSKLINPG